MSALCRFRNYFKKWIELSRIDSQLFASIFRRYSLQPKQPLTIVIKLSEVKARISLFRNRLKVRRSFHLDSIFSGIGNLSV